MPLPKANDARSIGIRLTIGQASRATEDCPSSRRATSSEGAHASVTEFGRGSAWGVKSSSLLFTLSREVCSIEKSGWITLEGHPASQLRSNARVLNSGRLAAVPFHRNQLACSSSRSNWRQTFCMAAGLVDPSEAVPRRRRRSQSGDRTSNRLSCTYFSGMDQVGRMELNDSTFAAGQQADPCRLLFGHPFHNLLPPRHPMPPCLDTLPPALGAPHN